MEVKENRVGDVLAVSLEGRMDGNTSGGVETALLSRIEEGNTKIVANLSHLEYISSAGLKVFLVAAKLLSEVQGRIVLCEVQDQIHQIFEIAGFTNIFTFYPTQREAIASFG